MAKEKNTIRLLILDDSQNDAEQLVSVLRNAGHATRAHRITSVDDLQQSLQQNWDLCLAVPQTSFISAADACNQIARQSRDIPFILLPEAVDEQTRIDALRQGMQDAVPVSAESLLVLVVNRELASLEARRQRRIAEQSLRETEKRCQLLLDSSVDAIAYVHDGMHIYANRAYLELFGYEDADELAAEPMIGLVAAADQAGFKGFLRDYASRGGDNEMQCKGQTATGEEFAMRMSFSPASYDSEPCTQVVIRKETASAEFEEKLRQMASQDLVTGLLNRNAFQEKLETLSEQVVREGRFGTLAYLSIDNFNSLQTSIGLGGTDLLLADLAQLLRNELASDNTLLARFGDDSCSLWVADSEPDRVAPQLQQLLKKIEGHLFDISGRTVQITASIGIAAISETCPQPAEAINRVLRLSEQCVQDGGNRLKVFDPVEELARQASRGNLVALISHAIETDNLRLMYQPVVSLQGDSSEHYECFLELLNAEGKAVPPGEYLPAATEAGLALKLDRWQLERGLRELAVQRGKGHDTRLLINLNASSLQDPQLLQWLAEQLKQIRLPPDCLILQFSENDATTYMKQAKAFSDALHTLHCRLSLRDFGGALNPYALLKHVQADYLRLEGSFSNDLGNSEAVQTLKEMVSSLHKLGKLCIVPGVDSASTMPTLWQAGINYIQGSYLQPPMPTMTFDFSAE